MNAANVISARDLSKRYNGKAAVDNISFDIPAGRIVGLIGPNGSGKTTTLKAALGLASFEGELKVLGRDPRTERDALMQDVCFIADVAVLPRWITVQQALDFTEGVHPRFDRRKAEGYLAHTKLKPAMKVAHMSKGMIVQLHLAIVMAIDAKLLVLDEPTLGLDILYRKQFYQNLLEDYFRRGQDDRGHHPPGRGDRAHPHRPDVHQGRKDRAVGHDGRGQRTLHRGDGRGRPDRSRARAQARSTSARCSASR
jgi:ABC-2 type transport system ATP-binding protein